MSRIVAVDTFQVSVPTRQKLKMAIGEVSGIEYVIVRVTTDDGVKGFGEAALEQGPIFSEETVASVADVVQRFIKPRLLGEDPLEVAFRQSDWAKGIRRNHFAKAAVEIALLDAAGRCAGLPVHRLLGGKRHDALGLSVSLATGDPDAEIAEGEAHISERGLGIFKIKAGFLPFDVDIRRIRRIVEHFSGRVRLRIDVNEGWSFAQTRKAVDLLSDLPLDFLEQPVPRSSGRAMADLTLSSRIPIAADESVWTAPDAINLCADRAADVVSIKIQKSGGPVEARRIENICNAAGMSTYLGGMFETGIGTAAALHFGSTMQDVDLGCELYGPFGLASTLVSTDFVLKGGRLHVPDGPGLGIEVDERALQEFALH